jgi:hypothetical protein
MFVLRRRLLSTLIKTPSNKPLKQASNAVETWSEDQQTRQAALTGPRYLYWFIKLLDLNKRI